MIWKIKKIITLIIMLKDEKDLILKKKKNKTWVTHDHRHMQLVQYPINQNKIVKYTYFKKKTAFYFGCQV